MPCPAYHSPPISDMINKAKKERRQKIAKVQFASILPKGMFEITVCRVPNCKISERHIIGLWNFLHYLSIGMATSWCQQQVYGASADVQLT